MVTVTLRMTPSQLAKLDARATSLGLDRSRYVRAAIYADLARAQADGKLGQASRLGSLMEDVWCTEHLRLSSRGCGAACQVRHRTVRSLLDDNIESNLTDKQWRAWQEFLEAKAG